MTNFEVSDYARLLRLIKPFYRELVYILLRKGEYPLSELNWSEDDRDSFRCYRTDISDTFLYCFNVLNLELFDMLFTRLTEILRKKSYQWNELEACLHAVSSVAECTETENLYFPRMMLTIKDIPFQSLNIKVLNTAITTIGKEKLIDETVHFFSFTKYLMYVVDDNKKEAWNFILICNSSIISGNYSGLMSENEAVLEYTLPIVIEALENPDTSLTATMALKDITNSCQKFMIPYAEAILNQIQV